MRALIACLTLLGAALGQNYILKSVVVDEAGSPLQSASYRADFSAGQTVASSWLASTTFRAVLGFWHGPYASGGIEGQPPPVTERMSLAVSPSLVRNRATVRYTLPNETNVRLQLVDNAGRVLGSLVSARQMSGSYRVAWNFSTAPGIGAGVYFLRLTASGASIVSRIVIVR